MDIRMHMEPNSRDEKREFLFFSFSFLFRGGGCTIWNSVLHRARRNMITGVQRILPEMAAGSSAQVVPRVGLWSRSEKGGLIIRICAMPYIHVYI